MSKALKTTELIDLGEFQVQSSIRATDPCYPRGTWCAHHIENVLKGTWLGKVEKIDQGVWGVPCSRLIAVHKEYDGKVTELERDTPELCCVDSGQLGFFCDASYRGGEDESWYWDVSNITLAEMRAGTLAGGVVSSSGFGDGSYPLFVVRNKDGKAVYLEVVFFLEDESEKEVIDE